MNARPRVIHVGPCRSAKGGVASAIQVIASSGLSQSYDLVFWTTLPSLGRLRRLTACLRTLRVAARLQGVRERALVHVHVSAGGSFLRKAVVIVAARLAGHAVIAHVHSGRFMTFALRGHLRRRLVRRTLGQADGIIALSEQSRHDLAALAPPHKIAVVPNAVAVPQMGTERGRRIVFLGLLCVKKGVDDLLEAVRLLQGDEAASGWEVVLAGDGDVRRVRERSAAVVGGPAVRVTGWLERAEVEGLLASSSIFVLPSYEEGLPMSLLEAMAAGLAVVATPVGGVPEVIEDGMNGVIVEPGDVESLANALRGLIQNEPLRRRLGDRARAAAQEARGEEALSRALCDLYGGLGFMPAGAECGDRVKETTSRGGQWKAFEMSVGLGERLAGYDPYDALCARRIPRVLLARALSRQLVVQVRKRLPWDLSLPLGIPGLPMAKSAGCLLTVAARDLTSGGGTAEDVDGYGNLLLSDDRLARCPRGAWGYEFDVQTRWGFYPSGSPNLVATFFVARGFGEAGVACGREEWSRELTASARYLVEAHASERGHLTYTPDNSRLIHNANLLGAGLLAVASRTGRDSWLAESALRSARISIAAQRPDGSWPYGEGPDLGWSDNFHTAYNLDGLLLTWLATADAGTLASLELGIRHWTRDFFGPDGEPKYCPRKVYPYDIHSAGTAVDVAARLATWGFDTGALAERVAAWTERNLIDRASGKTYYQKHRLFTDKRHFVRWGDAHWALGRSSLALLRSGRRSPLEEAAAQASGVAA
ncbi:MAG: glycosyltransferase family 4 protein [Coriobacteriia bacterium]|nr:glycosyltransferase family 4 protein [Coriobacteriia bacterium]